MSLSSGIILLLMSDVVLGTDFGVDGVVGITVVVVVDFVVVVVVVGVVEVVVVGVVEVVVVVVVGSAVVGPVLDNSVQLCPL